MFIFNQPFEAGIAETGLHAAELEQHRQVLSRVDQFGRDASQREWTAGYQRLDAVNDDGDVIPDGAFSSTDGDADDVAEIGDVDSELEDPSTFSEFDLEAEDMIAEGFALCEAGRIPDHDPIKIVDDDDGGSTGRSCALR